MNCLKCGNQTDERAVFCSQCLAVMDQYPVKPGTAVVLPQRETEVAEKKVVRRRAPTTEEQLRSHKKAIRWLILTICILLIALLFTSGMLLQALQPQEKGQEIGKNYTTTTSGTQP